MREKITDTIEVPANVTIEITDFGIRVRGPKGELIRKFQHPLLSITKQNSTVTVCCEKARKKERALVGTIAAHIRNMIRGVTDGFEYRLKAVYAHFPIKITVKGKDVIIENFLGEKTPRIARLIGHTTALVKGNELTLFGPDIEEVGQSAANIEQTCRIKHKDPRVFQDGIFIVKKG